MNTNSTRRVATATDMKVGALVYKGQGTTLYRVWRISPAYEGRFGERGASASVVKATTKTDPKVGTSYTFSNFTVEDVA
jgi:hypothetical protein